MDVGNVEPSRITRVLARGNAMRAQPPDQITGPEFLARAWRLRFVWGGEIAVVLVLASIVTDSETLGKADGVWFAFYAVCLLTSLVAKIRPNPLTRRTSVLLPVVTLTVASALAIWQ
jgi:hypothetical protein